MMTEEQFDKRVQILIDRGMSKESAEKIAASLGDVFNVDSRGRWVDVETGQKTQALE